MKGPNLQGLAGTGGGAVKVHSWFPGKARDLSRTRQDGRRRHEVWSKRGVKAHYWLSDTAQDFSPRMQGLTLPTQVLTGSGKRLQFRVRGLYF